MPHGAVREVAVACQVVVVDKTLTQVGVGTPFFLKSGMRLSARLTAIAPKVPSAKLAERGGKVFFLAVRAVGGTYFVTEDGQQFPLVCFGWVIFTVEHVPS